MRVELRDLGKDFGRVRALSGVSLDIPSGSRVALVGPNGSGKSTLTRALVGLVCHDGTVLLDGEPPGEKVRARIAYAPQAAPQTSVPLGELVDAVAAVRGIDRARIVELAARFELDLDGLRRRPFRALSGGMKQKALLALALATRASLYILDEPTASLDARARATFFRLYEEISPEATLILCSHRLEEIRRLVDRAVFLEDGRLAYDGPVDRFLSDRAASVVELLVGAEADLDWLRGQGFTAGAGGWWARLATAAEKRQLLPAAFARLGDGLRDVAVRDLETFDRERSALA